MWGHSGHMGGVGDDWGGGEWLWNEAGRLGLGACQFGLSERFRPRSEDSLWGGGSLQSLEWQRLASWWSPVITSKCGWHVARRSGGYSVCYCAKPVGMRHGHVTCSVFARGVPCTLGAGVGVEGIRELRKL
jgi:hypothetical protein